MHSNIPKILKNLPIVTDLSQLSIFMSKIKTYLFGEKKRGIKSLF